MQSTKNSYSSLTLAILMVLCFALGAWMSYPMGLSNGLAMAKPAAHFSVYVNTPQDVIKTVQDLNWILR